MQFLRPDSNITQSNFTGGFAEIDEATASDADYAYSADNTIAVLEVGLESPSSTPLSDTTTVRYRVAKTFEGTVNGTGNSVTVTCRIYDGATLIKADSPRTVNGTWTEYSFTPNMSGVSDWSDLRLRFTTSASGGGGAGTMRGVAISWVEVEAPDSAIVAALGMAGETDTALALAGKLFAPVGLAAEADAAAAPGGEIDIELALETDEALALAYRFMFDKHEAPVGIAITKDELPQGIFDPAIFDPAIFDTGSHVAVTKDAKPPTVTLE